MGLNERASPLGPTGWRTGMRWATRQQATRLADGLADDLAGRGEVVTNPHLVLPAIGELARTPAIVAAVTAVLGPQIAVEGGFLLSKPPGGDFAVPWHQDGINDRTELDPARSVTVWAALTDATADNGALQVLPGSWRAGYLPYHRETRPGDGRGRGLTTDPPPGSADPVLVPVDAGKALLMDVRLLHRSGRNTTTSPRIGLNLRYIAPGAVTHRTTDPPAGLYPITGTTW